MKHKKKYMMMKRVHREERISILIKELYSYIISKQYMKSHFLNAKKKTRIK